jgi:hypothetical protein
LFFLGQSKVLKWFQVLLEINNFFSFITLSNGLGKYWNKNGITRQRKINTFLPLKGFKQHEDEFQSTSQFMYQKNNYTTMEHSLGILLVTIYYRMLKCTICLSSIWKLNVTNVFSTFETTKIAWKFTIKMKNLIKFVGKMVTSTSHTWVHIVWCCVIFIN